MFFASFFQYTRLAACLPFREGGHYYLHRVNDQVPVEEVAAVMGRLINGGLIRGWGLSQVSDAILAKAHKVRPVSAVQNLYSMLERDCEKEIFPFCLENNIGVVPFSPIASGFLSGKVTAETKFEGDDVRKFVPQLTKENIVANQPILDILAQFAAQKNATNAQISLAWMLHKYPNVVPIPGSKNRERILENLGAWNVELTDEEFSAIEAALDACAVHGHRGHVESEGTTFSNNWKEK
ncbi:MAG: aldo/keto reductase [Oscillospiraceae bacterium]